MDVDDISNLWLAEELHRQGGVRFGDFTLGRSTRHSPVYIDVKVLLRVPQVLRRAAELIVQETQAELGRRRGRFVPFDLVAGVPFGGLHLATAFAIQSNTPMIYAIPHHDGSRQRMLEGHYRPGQQVLIIDDLMTTGGSFLETQRVLTEAGLRVRDAIVLVDRDQGGADRLRRNGIQLVSILRLPVMLTYYMSQGYISEDQYQRSMEYVRTHRAD